MDLNSAEYQIAIREQPMELSISGSEGIIYKYDSEGGLIEKKLGFVGGATITDILGNTIVSVGGSDEYSFSIKNIIHYKVKRASKYHLREIIAIMR